MSFNTNTIKVRTYQAPDCDACEIIAGTIICQSGLIEDWEYDENGF